LLVVPELDLTVAILTNSNNPFVGALAKQLAAIFAEAPPDR
jgi:hypothetical protein